MQSVTPSRLARRLSTLDAVALGVASMVGAGVFVAVGPAGEAAGAGLLIGLALAGAVAYCNATSSGRLAAVYPDSGGTYVYGRQRLGNLLGFIAGWAFVIGKLASCAAIALAFGTAVAPPVARAVAVAAVVSLTAPNYLGVHHTALATRLLVLLVLIAIAAALTGGKVEVDNLSPFPGAGARDILQVGGILFFAFAGYARIATLGEEVSEPAKTIPRALSVSLDVVLFLYVEVCVAALLVLGPSRLAASAIPLLDVVPAGGSADLAIAVKVGAAIATLSVLLALIAGVSRTVFAMAAGGDLPAQFSAVHPRFRAPHRAQLAVGAVGCVVLATSLPTLELAVGAGIVLAGVVVWLIARGAARAR
ncbi:MAG: amino acid permease [Actinomycetia bacterium]|nr:amino acid permease [Actinomycetes bacterium]